MRLYEMTQAINSLLESEELDTQTIEDTLESLEYDFKDKAVGIVKLTKEWEGKLSVIDAEVKRLSERKETMKNNIDRLRSYLKLNMEASGYSKIEDALFTISLRAGRDVAVINDEDSIPDEFVSFKRSCNKTAILAALKAGEKVKGAEMQKGEKSLVIK